MRVHDVITEEGIYYAAPLYTTLLHLCALCTCVRACVSTSLANSDASAARRLTSSLLPEVSGVARACRCLVVCTVVTSCSVPVTLPTVFQ